MVCCPRPMTINELTEEFGIDLSLTGGNGLYLSVGKEKMWPERKVVICDKETGENTHSVSELDVCTCGLLVAW